MFIGSTILSLVSSLIQIALFVLIVVALATAFMHPNGDFTDKGTKALWVAVLAIGVLLGVDRIFFRVVFLIPGFIKTIAYWGCIFAAMYFLASEHVRMGRSGGFTWKSFIDRRKPGGGNTGDSHGWE